ncbi:MAG: hypothetical protein HY904_17180 [Deltaproteobacteria bacterium]|nr:hypothetical protein [Deltaproteobacteria bacterium]
MRRVALLAGLLGAGRVWAGPAAALHVTAEVDGEAAPDCVLRAYAAGSLSRENQAAPEPVATGKVGEDVELKPGKYDVALECPVESRKVDALSRGVAVKAGKATPLAVKIEKGAFIVHGVHGDSRAQKGEYTVWFEGTAITAGQAAVGSRVTVAAGNYDVKLETEVDGEPVVVLVQKYAVKAGRPQVLNMDISPGMVKLLVTRNGKPAEGGGAVTFPGQRERIKEFTAGEPVPVSPGTYDVLGSLASSFDFTEKRQRKVVIKAGEVTEVKMDLPRGTVRTTCTMDGKEVPASVQGFIPGAPDYFNTAPCGQILELSPGKYQFKLVLDAEKAGWKVQGGVPPPEVWHRNVVVAASKGGEVKADWTPARLRVTAKKNGTPTEAAVTVLKPGGPAVGGGPAGEELVLIPGRYDVELLFPGKRGPARELVRGVDCPAGKTSAVGVNLERATLTLDVFAAGQPRADAEVLLFKEGSDIPYARGKAGEELEVPPGDWVPEARAGELRRQFSRMRLRAGDREHRKVELE